MVKIHFLDDNPDILNIIDIIAGIAGENYNVPFDFTGQPSNAAKRNFDDLLQYQLPGGTSMVGMADQAISESMGTAINSLVQEMAPFLAAYGLILPILGVIKGIIEVLCSLINPWSVRKAVKKFKKKYIPPFISLFPPAAGAIITISTIKLILAVVFYILTTLIPMIMLIIKSAKDLSKAILEDQSDLPRDGFSELTQEYLDSLTGGGGGADIASVGDAISAIAKISGAGDAVQEILDVVKDVSEGYVDHGARSAQDSARELLISAILELLNQFGPLATIAPIIEIIMFILKLMSKYPCKKKGKKKKTDGLPGLVPAHIANLFGYGGGLIPWGNTYDFTDMHRGYDEDEDDMSCCDDDVCPPILKNPPKGKAFALPTYFADSPPWWAWRIIPFTGKDQIRQLKPYVQGLKAQLDSQLDEAIDEAKFAGQTSDPAHFSIKITGRRGGAQIKELPIAKMQTSNGHMFVIDPGMVSYIGSVDYEIVPNWDMLIAHNIVAIACDPEIEELTETLSGRFPDLEENTIEQYPETETIGFDYTNIVNSINNIVNSIRNVIINIVFGSNVGPAGEILDNDGGEVVPGVPVVASDGGLTLEDLGVDVDGFDDLLDPDVLALLGLIPGLSGVVNDDPLQVGNIITPNIPVQDVPDAVYPGGIDVAPVSELSGNGVMNILRPTVITPGIITPARIVADVPTSSVVELIPVTAPKAPPYDSEVATIERLMYGLVDLLGGYADDLKEKLGLMVNKVSDKINTGFEVDKNLVKSDGVDFATVYITPRDVGGTALLQSAPDGISVDINIISTFGTLSDTTLNRDTGVVTAEISSAFPGESNLTLKINGELVQEFDGETARTKTINVKFVSDSTLPKRRLVSKPRGTSKKQSTVNRYEREPGGK